MKRALATVALVVWAVWAGQVPAQKAVAPKLDGTWKGYVVMGKGENPNDGPLYLQLVVQGNKMSAVDLRAKKDLGEGTFTLDVARKGLDATGTVMGAGKNRAYPGIYDLDGDTLKWCVDNQGKARPTELITRKAQYLLILKRQK